MKQVTHRAAGMLLAAAGLICGAASNTCSAEERSRATRIHATGWGITLAVDGSGFYNDFADFAFGDPALHADYRISPYKRAVRAFLEDKNSCVYPKSIAVIRRTHMARGGNAFIESDAMLRSPVRIFSAADTPVITRTEDLAGLRLAFALGSKLPESIGRDDVRFVPVADEADKAKLLYTGTVDAVVANMPDAFFVFDSLGRDLPRYDPAYSPFPEPKIRVFCHDTAENRVFISALNARINAVVTSGEASAFLSRAGLKPGRYLPRPQP